MNSDYGKYKRLKSCFEFEYRGFTMDSILATILIGITFENKRFHLFKVLKNLFRVKSFAHLNKIIELDSPLVTYSTDKRKDYLELIDAYVSKLNIKAIKSIVTTSENILYINVKHYVDAWKIVAKIENLGLKQKIYLWSSLVNFQNLIDYLYLHPITLPKEYYAFNGSYGYETLLTQYFQLQGIRTYSFQHGMYYLFVEPIVLDVINYENFTSDYMLCWGEYTKRELVKFGIDEKHLIVFGNPKYSKYTPYIKHRTKFKTALIALARVQFNDENQVLLDLVSKIKDVDFEIKLHPSLDSTYYKELVQNKINLSVIKEELVLTECLKKDYDFVITYNTTVYYEACSYGKITFDYAYKTYYATLESFQTSKELAELLYRYENYSEDEINNKLASFSKDTLGV